MGPAAFFLVLGIGCWSTGHAAPIAGWFVSLALYAKARK